MNKLKNNSLFSFVMVAILSVSAPSVCQSTRTKTLTTATATIKSSSDGKIRAIVQGDAKHGNKVFFLQLKSPISMNSTTIADAVVTVDKDWISFKSASNGKSIVFKLNNSSTVDNQGETVIRGIGLGWQIDAEKYEIHVQALALTTFPPVVEICYCNAIGTVDGCASGGEGSTSCSQTYTNGSGCSTNCSSGYYACCN